MRRFLPLLLAVALPLCARAQAPLDTTRVYELRPVVITGTPIQVARENLPLTVSVVSESEIRQAGEQNLLPILTGRVPGLFVTERGVAGFGIATGAAGQISIRGIGGSPNTQVLVLVDGHPQFMGLFGHPLGDTYAAADAERVEVVRGPASILYGTGAMGGVINVISHGQPSEGPSLAGRASYGSYGSAEYGLSGGYRRGGKALYASVNHNRTDGHRPSSDFDATSAYLKGSARLAPGVMLLADGGLTDFRALDPGAAGSPAAAERWAEVQRGRASVSVENRRPRLEGAARVFYSYGDHAIYDGFHSDDYNVGVMLYQGVRLRPGSTFTLGADYKRYGGEAGNTLQNTDLGAHRVGEAAGYALLQHAFGGRATLNAGARLEHHSRYGLHTTPQVGLSVHAAPLLTLKASAARGFRSPSIRELFLFPPANPDLKPEQLWNYEAGVLYARGRMRAELTAFLAEGEDLIQTEGRFPNVRNFNSGAFRHRGVEWEGVYNATRRLRLRTSYSYLHTRRPVLAAPAHMGHLEAGYTRGRFGLTAQVQHIRDLNVAPAPARRTETYTLVNAYATFRPSRYAELFVRGENLADQQYEINSGYPLPGATFFTGFHVRL